MWGKIWLLLPMPLKSKLIHDTWSSQKLRIQNWVQDQNLVFNTLIKLILNFFKFTALLYKHPYSKIPKISPGLIFFKGWGAYIWRGLSTEGNLHFKIDWASLIFGINLPFLLCFTLYLRAIFQIQTPGGLIFGGGFNGGFFALPDWGAYIWRGLFSEFYGI